MANLCDLVGFALTVIRRRFTFIFSLNLDISPYKSRYKFAILRLFNIFPYISLYFEHNNNNNNNNNN